MRKYIVFLVFLIACNSKEKPSIYYGNVNIGIDESIFKLIQAETDAYSHKYRGASFNNFAIPENVAVQLLLSDSMDVICISRLLNEKEMEIVKDRGIEYRPAPFAHDGVILIVHPEADLSDISFSQLKQMFSGEDKSYKLVFDTGNSSNLNLVLEKLGLDNFDKSNVVAAGNNQKVFDRVQKDKKAIGFVGFNLISETKSSASVELANSIKVLSVNSGEGSVNADKETLLDKTYPFSRIIYLHTLGNAWAVENGFIRFACSQPGQLIVDKMGLTSYYYLPSQFYLSKDPVEY